MKELSNLLVRTFSPSSTLEGDIFPTETDLKQPARENLALLGLPASVFMEKTAQFPYELARLNDAGGDLSKRWCVSFRVWDTRSQSLVRKQKWISSKCKTKPARKAQAEKLIRAINELLAKGYHLSDPDKIPKSQQKHRVWTWADAFDWVYEHRKPSLRKRSIETLELVRTELKVWIEQQGMQVLAIQHVRHEHCDAYMQWLRIKRKLGNATYNNYLSFLKLNFNYLIKQGKLEVSPAKKLTPLKIDECEKDAFPPVAQSKLLHAYQQQAPDLLLCAQYIFYTFIRPGELRKLRVKHVLAKTIFIPGYIAKNGKSAHVLITPAMERILQRLRVRGFPAEYFLISHDGGPGSTQVSVNYFTQKHLAIRRELGLPDTYTLYCWKHTGATATYLHTLDIEFVSRQCRHSSLDMTKNYLRGLGVMEEYPHQERLPDLGL